MPVRRLPVRPNLEQLKRQAKELLNNIHAGDANAIAELREHHPDSIDPSAAKLADAQFVLARSYQASSWTKLVHSVQLADAIWRDDLDTVRTLITGDPNDLLNFKIRRSGASKTRRPISTTTARALSKRC